MPWSSFRLFGRVTSISAGDRPADFDDRWMRDYSCQAKGDADIFVVSFLFFVRTLSLFTRSYTYFPPLFHSQQSTRDEFRKSGIITNKEGTMTIPNNDVFRRVTLAADRGDPDRPFFRKKKETKTEF